MLGLWGRRRPRAASSHPELTAQEQTLPPLDCRRWASIQLFPWDPAENRDSRQLRSTWKSHGCGVSINDEMWDP